MSKVKRQRPKVAVFILNRGRRRARTVQTATAALLLAGVAACNQPVIDMYDAQDAAPSSATRPYRDADWTLALRDNVKAGLVDYAHLAEHPEALKAYLAQLRHVGPQSTPEQFRKPGASLAYYINVYNACVLAAVLRAGVPISMYDARLPDLETGYRFLIDGRPRTLFEIHQYAGQAARGNARVEFALSRAAKGMPALASEPYRGFDVFNRLEELGHEAMGDATLVRVDHEKGVLFVGLPIWQRRSAFKTTYCRETGSESATLLNCFMHLAEAPQREDLVGATGYTLRLMPFDRALNIWKPRRAP